MGKKNRNESFEGVDDNDVKDGAWKIYNKRNGNSFTNTRSATSKNAVKQNGTSAVFQLMEAAGGNNGTSAPGASKLLSSNAMAKLEDAFINSRYLYGVETMTTTNSNSTTSVAADSSIHYEQSSLVDTIVDVLRQRIGEVIITCPPDTTKDPAFIDVSYLLLGVGELDNAPSNLQMGLGMAVARKLHGRPLGDDSLRYGSLAAADEGTNTTASSPLIRVTEIVTYDPMISVGVPSSPAVGTAITETEGGTAAPTAAAAANTKGLDGYLRRWNNLVTAQVTAWSKAAAAASIPPTSSSTSPLPPLPFLSYDNVNRLGAYAVDEVYGARHAIGEGRTNTSSTSRRIMIAFTPHCPRALYQNLLVSNLSATGGVSGAEDSSVAQSSSAASPLRRLIIVGNDITSYTRHDKKCLMEGITTTAAPHQIQRLDFRSVFVSGSVNTSPTLFDKLSTIKGCAICVTSLEKLLQEAASKDAVELRQMEMEKNLPKRKKSGAAKGCEAPSNTTSTSTTSTTTITRKYVTVASKGKYGSHTTSESERAFSDLCIVTFGPQCEEMIGGLPASMKKIMVSGDDLL